MMETPISMGTGFVIVGGILFLSIYSILMTLRIRDCKKEKDDKKYYRVNFENV